jgi:hypothetical protein
MRQKIMANIDRESARTPIRIGLPARSSSDIRLDHTDNILKSCCGGTSDKRLITLLMQIGISTIILCFSAAMLAFSEQEDRAIYMSLISSILSYWLGKNEQRHD